MRQVKRAALFVPTISEAPVGPAEHGAYSMSPGNGRPLSS